MAYSYVEEEAWKCPKHPSKKRRTTTGVCSICLRDRLSKLCPHCANVRPCSSNCAAGKISGGEPAFCRSKSVGIPFLKLRNDNSGDRRNQPESEKSNKTTSSSSSSGNIIGGGSQQVLCRSKSVGIRFLKERNVSSGDRRHTPESEKSNKTTIIGGGEPAFCRSKSVGIPFLQSRNVNSGDRRKLPESEKSNKTASFWWIFRRRGKENEMESMTMMRSRSVNVEMTSVPGGNDVIYSPGKLKGWYLVSPMKVFRQSSRTPKLVN